MKNFYSILFLLFLGFSAQAQTVVFPDNDLKTTLLLSSPDFHIAKNLSGDYFKIDVNNDGEIQVSEALQVSYIDLHVFTGIENMAGIGNFTNLKTLYASNNVQTLNLNGLINLEYLYCTNNHLTALDVSSLTNLKSLDCSWGTITLLNCSGLTNLLNINCSVNPLNGGSLNLSSVINLKTLVCTSNGLTSLNVNGLSQLEALNCSNNLLTTLDLSGLSSLQNLNIGSNQLSSINLSNLNNLTVLACPNNQFSSINLSSLNNLYSLDCSYNLLSSLDVSNLNNLTGLYCSNNQLTSLDVSNLSLLEYFECRENQLTALDFAGLNNLISIYCDSNQISTLDISSASNLEYLLCQNNLLTSLDLSNMSSLYNLRCENNQLITLNIKNGANEYFDFLGNPNLEYVCADDHEIDAIQYLIENGFTNCHVNTYCSFTPGGTFYTMQGNCYYDGDGNGCDINDINYPNLNLSFSDGTTVGNVVANDTGAYHYDVQPSTQTITPVLENPTYFTVSPASVTVTFPDQSSPFAQNYCIVPNGVHHDLEIMLIPMIIARPGFDAFYKIVYKNKGTNTQSGSINLSFDDAVLDFTAADPTSSSQATNSVSWSFSNLLPFESREILVTFNVNSPQEFPSVNSGDILSFTATVVGLTDETPNDNTVTLNQTVFNSFDPNDKTCLEGSAITPSMIGEYVHYIIRFENTGNFAAQNIVVKDVIDTTKFDISTLVPQNSSHPFVTRITNTNQVEFIFENINLPFDDANNDGYVAFKIKTKPTLTLGDSFSNTANIYFDYNFPIVTNTATTAIQTLGNQDFEFSSLFSLSPVPAKDLITITTKESVLVSSVSIYNILGQLVQVNTNQTQSIDVSGLQSGSYFIKITTDRGNATGKFIKE